MINSKFQTQNMCENIFCSCNSIASKVQIKDLTHMLCFQNLISQTI